MCLHPRDHLPSEMWAEIFRHLKSPKDLYNVMEAHPFFAELLEFQLPDIQFQLVFPLLVHVLDQRRKADKSPVTTRIPYLSTYDTLRCRLVCKSWDKAVRTYYQGPLYHNYMDRSPFIDGRNLTQNQFCGVGLQSHLVLDPCIFFSPNALSFLQMGPDGYRRWLQSTLISHPPNTDTNPLLSQEWNHNVIWEGAAIRNYAEIRETLQAYGSHLQRFQIGVDNTTIPLQALYTALRDWLTFTPNLLSLCVSMGEVCEAVLIPPEEEVTALQNYIPEHPLPHLPNLDSLLIYNIPHPIQKEFLEKYHQAKSIYLHPRGWNWKWEGPQSALLPLESWLRTLLLRIRSEEDLLILGEAHHPSWIQLQHLEVDFSYQHHIPRLKPDVRVQGESYAPSWEKIISLLNQNFGQAPRLANLLLCLPQYEPSKEAAVLRDTQRCRLQLRNVQQFKLRVMNRALLVDFLLPMKDSLQKMAIEYMWKGVQEGDFPLNEKVDFQEKVSWNGYFGKELLNSNLWIVFPKLDFLRIESFKGWTYRRRTGSQPTYINVDGTEERIDEDDYKADNEVRVGEEKTAQAQGSLCPIV